MNKIRLIIGIVILLLIAGCTSFVFVSQIRPRLIAGDHTGEMCAVLQRYHEILKQVSVTGDVSRLIEIYPPDIANDVADNIRSLQGAGKVDTSIVRTLACKATYYTRERAEIEATERVWYRTMDAHTGEVIVPDSTGPFFVNMARESEFTMVFVKEDGRWKYYKSEEHSWRPDEVEPP